MGFKAPEPALHQGWQREIVDGLPPLAIQR